MILLIIVVILLIIIFWIFGMYNGLVRLRNQVKNAWSQIDVQLKRRHDLIPNLVETAKGYMKHERETLDSITRARSHAVEASGVADQAKAEGELNNALSRFMLVVENYPDQTEAVKLAREKLSILQRARAIVEKEDQGFKMTEIPIDQDKIVATFAFISPDGKKVASVDPTGDIWVTDVAGGEVIQLTKTPEFEGPCFWSPDSQKIAYVGVSNMTYNLYMVSARGGTPKTLIKKDRDADYIKENGDFWPSSWSPDSRYIAFFVGTKHKKVPVAGGPAQTICEAGGADGSWSSRGEIVFDGSAADPLWRVPAAGGVAKPEVSPADIDGVTSVGWPEFLPDGRRFLYVAGNDGGSSSVMLHTLGEANDVELTTVDSRVQYAEPGYLIYVLDGMLVAHPFDAGKGELTGEPMPLADNIGASAVGLADFSASVDRTLAFRSGESGGRQLRWFDREGRELGDLSTASDFRNFRLSPDGKRVGTEVSDAAAGTVALWVHDLERGTASRFTFDAGADSGPLWSRDGESIIYTSAGDTGTSLIRKAASGTGATETLLASDTFVMAGDVSPDGKHLLYMEAGEGTTWDIMSLALDGSGESYPLLRTEFVEVRPVFSPDGRWFAYNSNESGKMEVYVRQFPGPGGQWQISTDGGTEAVWSADGGEIFYIDSGRNLVSVPVSTGSTLEAGLPSVLFDPPIFPVTQRERYVVTRDGQSFLMLSTTSGVSVRPTTVVLNWDVGLQE